MFAPHQLRDFQGGFRETTFAGPSIPVPLTRGAITTASTPVPPTAHPTSVTATATLTMRAAHVSEQMSYVCGLILSFP